MPSKIEWTEETWNPSVGCTKVSAGCENCYAEVMSKRLQAMGNEAYSNGFRFTLRPERLDWPTRNRKPKLFFVNSMSDLFHEEMPDYYIDLVFETIKATQHHMYQVLTKRPERMLEYFINRNIPQNVMVGTTVENRSQGLPRIQPIRQLEKARIRFLSIEPLLEDLEEVNLKGINWVIVGGESGPKARPMDLQWVTNIRDQCMSQHVPFYFKQWGTWGPDMIRRSKKENGRMLEGRIWDEMPD